MIDTKHIEIDIQKLENLVNDYIQQNFSPDGDETSSASQRHGMTSFPRRNMRLAVPQRLTGGRFNKYNADTFNFLEIFKKDKEETFSEMLLRLITESGEENSAVYKRANIDRRHFSKIVNHEDYQPGKQTVLAFAIALKLGFEKTKALLAAAGFTLSNANLADVIVSAFIENQIFDVILVNQILYKYDQPLLGG